jgi:hypothetical protein
MSMGKRVTLSTLGLLLAGAATLAVASTSCAPDHNPNYPGAPFIAQVWAFDPNDNTVATRMYLPPANRARDCDQLDMDAGGGPQTVDGIPVGYGFRVAFSELIDGDKVEKVDDQNLGTELYAGLVKVTDRSGNAITSTLDPTLVLDANAFTGVYQPAGGSGCFGTVDTIDYGTGAPIPGPAFITSLASLMSMPSGSELRLVVDGQVPGHEIVDTGNTGLEGGQFTLDFTTAPMTVDCPSLDACNVVPLPDPTSEADLGTMGVVQVSFTAPVGVATGVALYEGTTAVTGVTAVVDSDPALANFSETQSPLTVDLIGGTVEAPAPLALTPGATYTIVVTDAVQDIWGVAAQTIAGDTTCADLSVTVTGCIWAGQFTMPAQSDGGTTD